MKLEIPIASKVQTLYLMIYCFIFIEMQLNLNLHLKFIVAICLGIMASTKIIKLFFMLKALLVNLLQKFRYFSYEDYINYCWQIHFQQFIRYSKYIKIESIILSLLGFLVIFQLSYNDDVIDQLSIVSVKLYFFVLAYYLAIRASILRLDDDHKTYVISLKIVNLFLFCFSILFKINKINLAGSKILIPFLYVFKSTRELQDQFKLLKFIVMSIKVVFIINNIIQHNNEQYSYFLNFGYLVFYLMFLFNYVIAMTLQIKKIIKMQTPLLNIFLYIFGLQKTKQILQLKLQPISDLAKNNFKKYCKKKFNKIVIQYIIKTQKSNFNQIDEICSICLNKQSTSPNFNQFSTMKCIKLKCGHYYHNCCLEKWFYNGKYQCPNCRRKIKDI